MQFSNIQQTSKVYKINIGLYIQRKGGNLYAFKHEPREKNKRNVDAKWQWQVQGGGGSLKSVKIRTWFYPCGSIEFHKILFSVYFC